MKYKTQEYVHVAFKHVLGGTVYTFLDPRSTLWGFPPTPAVGGRPKPGVGPTQINYPGAAAPHYLPFFTM